MTTLPTPSSPAVFHLGLPGPAAVDRALRAGAGAPLSYPLVGATAGALPDGWDHDDASRVVGRGDADWGRLRAAVRGWVPFALPWVRLHRPDAPLAVGEVVAFSSWQLGLWTLNVCRIVEVIDDDGPDGARFGFAYGTVDGHVVSGEERFLGTFRRSDGEVSFGIRKFSRLHHPLVRLAGPLARHLQRRFTAEAIDAVARAVAEGR